MKSFKAFLTIVFSIMFVFGFAGLNVAQAATSPTLVGAANYSILGATTVTNAGATTTVGEVGVSAGTAITGFPPGIAAGDNLIHLHSNDASAIAAQADNLTAFGALDAGANADANCMDPTTLVPGSIAVSGTDLAGLSLAPGLYCSAGTFLLTDGVVGYDLVLTGAGPWVFKTVSGVTTSAGSSVSVPLPADACDVWWRVGSSAVIGTTTDFKGNILALTSVALQNSATLVGRAMAQAGAVTLDTNTITGCAAPLAPANLTLNKIVDGGNASESTWTLTATGPTTFSGPGTTSATDVVSDVTAGTYVLSESTGPSRYTASPWSCITNGGPAISGSSLVLDWGDTATCTITNTYHPVSSGSTPNPTATEPTSASPAILTIIKQVVGGTADASSFNLHVKDAGVDVPGSPRAGVVTPGSNYSLPAGTYVVSEDANASYITTFSGDCDASGSVTISSGGNKTCIIINTFLASPSFPKTGFPPEGSSLLWKIIIPVGILGLAVLLYFALKKRTN
ncbi:MAG: ice-binding family protein [Candidatus Paceibacterota bacterium]